MNNQTSIYLLFKEYVDQSRPPSHQYIHGDTFSLVASSIENEFYSVIDVLDFFRYERENAYYDIDNFDGLQYLSALLPESYPNIEQTFLSQFAALGVTERPLIEEQKTFCINYMKMMLQQICWAIWHGANPKAFLVC